jgi:hypothetical protein
VSEVPLPGKPPEVVEPEVPGWDAGVPDFERASTALYSVEGAIGNHCAGVEEKCAVCHNTAELRYELDLANGVYEPEP